MLDFSSIAKGMALRRNRAYAPCNGAVNWLVGIGGGVMASGANTRGTAAGFGRHATYGRRRHKPPQSSDLTIALASNAVATSGNYRKWRMQDGNKLSHIIHPHTGDSRKQAPC